LRRLVAVGKDKGINLLRKVRVRGSHGAFSLDKVRPSRPEGPVLSFFAKPLPLRKLIYKHFFYDALDFFYCFIINFTDFFNEPLIIYRSYLV